MARLALIAMLAMMAPANAEPVPVLFTDSAGDTYVRSADVTGVHSNDFLFCLASYLTPDKMACFYADNDGKLIPRTVSLGDAT